MSQNFVYVCNGIDPPRVLNMTTTSTGNYTGWVTLEARQDATVESPVPDRDGECLVLWRHEERLKDAETRSEVRTLARKAVSKLREWPRCSEHDKALEITEVTTRGSEGKKDSVTLCCPQDGCFRHHIETFTLPAEFRRIAGPGVRFDLRGKE